MFQQENRAKLGRDAKWKCLYSKQAISDDDFKAIPAQCATWLGFQQLVKVLP
jgi:electron transfer flavoprotein alpha/beta subunit